MTWDPALPGSSEADAAARGSGIKLAAELSGRLLSLATSFLLAVGLGVERFGIFAAASGVAVILAEAADLGLQGTAVRALVARTIGLRAMLRAKMILTVAVGLFGALLLAAGPHLGTCPEARPRAPRAARLLLRAGGMDRAAGRRAAGGGTSRAEEAGVILALRAALLVAVVAALRVGGGLVALAWAHAASTRAGARRLGVPGPPGLPWAGMGRCRSPPTSAVLRTALPLAVNGGLALLSLRLELLAVFFVRGAVESGLFGAALKVVESLNGIPNAVAAGAMPSLTREALQALRVVRERVAGMMALLAVPGGRRPAPFRRRRGRAARRELRAARPRRCACWPLALVPLFMNTVLLHALIAAGHAGTLPRLTGVRVGLAAVLAVALIPPFGAMGAATGFLLSETLLTFVAARACAKVGFAVPVSGPLARAAALTLPMAAVVVLAGRGLAVSVALGVATYTATLAAIWRLKPELVPLLPRPRREGWPNERRSPLHGTAARTPGWAGAARIAPRRSGRSRRASSATTSSAGSPRTTACTGCCPTSGVREIRPFLELYQRVRRDEGWRAEACAARGAALDPALALAEAHLGPGPWKVLEAGAGCCWASVRLLERGHRVAAVDVNLDPDDGLPAANRLLAAPEDLPRAEAELDALPVEAGSFDLVLAAGSLHGVPRLTRTLVELRRVTRRGGVLVVLDSPVFRRRPDGEGMVAARMRRARAALPAGAAARERAVVPGARRAAGALLQRGLAAQVHGWPARWREWGATPRKSAAAAAGRRATRCSSPGAMADSADGDAASLRRSSSGTCSTSGSGRACPPGRAC